MVDMGRRLVVASIDLAVRLEFICYSLHSLHIPASVRYSDKTLRYDSEWTRQN